MLPRLQLAHPATDPGQLLVHEVPIGGRGDVEEAIGLGPEGGQFGILPDDLIPRVRGLDEDLLGDELAQDPLDAPGRELR